MPTQSVTIFITCPHSPFDRHHTKAATICRSISHQAFTCTFRLHFAALEGQNTPLGIRKAKLDLGTGHLPRSDRVVSLTQENALDYICSVCQ